MNLIKSTLFSFLILTTITAKAQNVTKDENYGQEGYKMVESQMGFYKFEPLETLLDKLGKRLVGQLENPLFEYEFYLVDSPQPNAFALPGGKIFVTRGLLALPLTEDELAGVIGHEIIHSNNRHAMKTSVGSVFGTIISIPGVIIGGIFRGPVGTAIASPFLAGNELLQADYSRSNEKEADKYGIALAAKAGYNPAELANILTRLSLEAEILTGKSEEQSYFASHPYTPKRVEAIHKNSGANAQSKTPHLYSEKEFLQLFDGLMLGENPAHGFIEEGKFYHPKHLFSFDLDTNWQTAITPESFSLGSKDGEAILSLTVQQDSLGYKEFLKRFQKEMLDQSRMSPDSKEDFEWYGYKGELLEYVSQSEEQTVIFRIMAIDYGNGNVFKIASIFTEKAQDKVDELMKNAKVIKKQELPKAHVSTLLIVKAKKGETLNDISKRNQAGEFAKVLMLLNECSLEHSFEKGDMVKVVIKKPYTL